MKMNRSEVAPYIIIIIIIVSFAGGLSIYSEATKDPYTVEISTNDDALIRSFWISDVSQFEKGFPFNVTVRQKSTRCWITAIFYIYDNGSYTEHRLEHTFFSYDSLIRNNRFTNITLSPFLYILITLIPTAE